MINQGFTDAYRPRAVSESTELQETVRVERLIFTIIVAGLAGR
jgi:hypothetical protein